jgi:glutamate formiminotransferase / 5-formyltetrahydrofolate cyclo-ligase
LLLDLHADPDHHRAVLTFAGPPADVEEAARALARAVLAHLRLTGHDGRHPRLGVLDVVPFVPLGDGRLDPAVAARDAFAAWAGDELDLPTFRYGPLPGGERSLPAIRRSAFDTLGPDFGPAAPHPTAGATAVGARGVLVAYNLWLSGGDVTVARSIARTLRGPSVRALGFDLAHGVQVSCNLIEPAVVGPAEVFDRVVRLAGDAGAAVERCELVGLLPAAVLQRIPPGRRGVLDLSAERTIEARLEERAR